MVDLLPAGVISHGLYGGSQHVQNQPNGAKNAFGVLKPGNPLNFHYEPAMVGAGFIACQGKRVCGATMTNDGFGRWAVPSAKDLADVFNTMTASNHSYVQYFDMTLDKVFEMISALQQEVRSLKGGGGGGPPPQMNAGWGGIGGGMGNGPGMGMGPGMGNDFGGNDVVQGRVVDGSARGAPRAMSADRTAATRRVPPGAAPDMMALESEVQELKRKFGMNMPADPLGGAAVDGKTPAAKTTHDTTMSTKQDTGGWDWRAKTTTPQTHLTPHTTQPASWDRTSSPRPGGVSATAPTMTPASAKPDPTSMPGTRPSAVNHIMPPAPADHPHGTRPSPWNRQTSPAPGASASDPPLPGAREQTPMQQRPAPASTGAPTSPVSPGSAKGGGTGAAGGYKSGLKGGAEDAVEVANLTAELDRCMMMRQVSAQSAGGQSLSNAPFSRSVTPGRNPMPHNPQQAGASGRFKGVPQSVATKLFIK